MKMLLDSKAVNFPKIDYGMNMCTCILKFYIKYVYMYFEIIYFQYLHCLCAGGVPVGVQSVWQCFGGNNSCQDQGNGSQ